MGLQFSGGDSQVRQHKQEAQQAMTTYDVALTELTGESWSSKTAVQKSEALRLGLVLVMRTVRFLMLRSQR